MIKYALQCHDCGQSFEGWFADSATYDKQARKKEIACPACASTNVGKAIMAPNIAVKSTKRSVTSPSPEATSSNTPSSGTSFSGAPSKTVTEADMRQFLQGVRRHIEDNCDNVGKDFANEARKIHHGEAEERGIYGEATKEERDALEEEGIDAVAIPWVPRSDA